jgi:demethylmenaquinone methyltransferase / 2-methoxy-6-polyprenyl-1,4-benzoquinol methylase
MSAPIQEIFDRVSPYYDRMNDVMSLGLHRLWKKQALCALAPKKGDWILDLACGSGDLSLPLAAAVGEQGYMVGADPSPHMLRQAKDRLIDRGYFEECAWIQTPAEQLPFRDNSFNKIIIGFGFRNFDDKKKALQELYRVLSPGGLLLILEFSKPHPCLAPAVSQYNRVVLPFLGQVIAKDKASYEYLAQSIEDHPSQEEVRTLLMQASFEGCQIQNLSAGIVAIHTGYKY